MKSFLETIDVKKVYRKKSVEVNALQGISFQIRKGEFVSVVGRSGSGKSTLLSLIGGLDTATNGTIRIRDNELTQMRRPQLAQYRQKTVGMVFQSFNLIPSRSALENVTLALTFGGVPKRKRLPLASEKLTRVGLGERLNHKPGELSGGEAQRVAIARALANNPEILLADEPTGNLDSKTSDEVIDLLRDLNTRGLTVILVTHEEKMAETVSHRIIKLHDGKIAEIKTGRRSL